MKNLYDKFVDAFHRRFAVKETHEPVQKGAADSLIEKHANENEEEYSEQDRLDDELTELIRKELGFTGKYCIENINALRIHILRTALEEIRDVAQVSEGVEFYAMIADKALAFDDYGYDRLSMELLTSESQKDREKNQ